MVNNFLPGKLAGDHYVVVLDLDFVGQVVLLIMIKNILGVVKPKGIDGIIKNVVVNGNGGLICSNPS